MAAPDMRRRAGSDAGFASDTPVAACKSFKGGAFDLGLGNAESRPFLYSIRSGESPCAHVDYVLSPFVPEFIC